MKQETVKFNKERHAIIIKLINGLLKSDSFDEECFLKEQEGNFEYLINNPHKKNEFIEICFYENNNAILYYSFSHVHIDGLYYLNDFEIASTVYRYLKEIFSDSFVIFIISYKNGNPCMGGCQLFTTIKRVYKLFKFDKYFKNCNKLEIKSWSGIHDKVLNDRKFSLKAMPNYQK